MWILNQQVYSLSISFYCKTLKQLSSYRWIYFHFFFFTPAAQNPSLFPLLFITPRYSRSKRCSSCKVLSPHAYLSLLFIHFPQISSGSLRIVSFLAADFGSLKKKLPTEPIKWEVIKVDRRWTAINWHWHFEYTASTFSCWSMSYILFSNLTVFRKKKKKRSSSSV